MHVHGGQQISTIFGIWEYVVPKPKFQYIY